VPALLRSEVYEHGHLVVRFTCSCGKKGVVDFTTIEYFDCTCGRRHYPTVRIVTHQQAKDES